MLRRGVFSRTSLKTTGINDSCFSVAKLGRNNRINNLERLSKMSNFRKKGGLTSRAARDKMPPLSMIEPIIESQSHRAYVYPRPRDDEAARRDEPYWECLHLPAVLLIPKPTAGNVERVCGAFPIRKQASLRTWEKQASRVRSRLLRGLMSDRENEKERHHPSVPSMRRHAGRQN